MGLFGKLKNIFYDEEYVEDTKEPKKESKKEIKKEVLDSTPRVEEIKIEKEEPKKAETVPVEKETNTFSERELFRSERTFNFTEFDDEEELLPRKNIIDIESRSRTVEPSVAPTISNESPKMFKPSPVISPIYGILDKDYKKNEILEKTQQHKTNNSTLSTYESVRRKAYGTLEDDLEDTLNSMSKVTENDIKKADEVKTMPEKDVHPSKIEDLITRIESTDSKVTVGELEDKIKDDEEEMDNEVEEKLDIANDKTMTDNTLEHDLFNLIDSMYDDKEE